ncbi:MAG: PSD1 and planctomycete cytochrome C domain-containing protein [Planctomycetota bacterium]
MRLFDDGPFDDGPVQYSDRKRGFARLASLLLAGLLTASVFTVTLFGGLSDSSRSIEGPLVQEDDEEFLRELERSFDEDEIDFFKEKVRPILEANCFDCHGNDPEKLGGGLALISRRMILEGGETGPAVEFDDIEDSLLIDAINYGSYEMPPENQLPEEEIAILTEWVEMGMPWTPNDKNRVIESGHGHGIPQVNAESMSFWSFQPVSRPEPPAVEHSDWVTNEIDHFILSRLENQGIQPAEPASNDKLIRRVYYDLTGLPPTPEQVQAFVDDDSPDAYDDLIEELLASPHYGEKWGRHWLDLVRYAESNSFERDGTKPFVWRYRDYVIESFNDDKPYDEFLIEQLAGDEIESPTNASIIATGYYRLGQWDDEPADPKQALYDDLDDILATTSQSMLGLTINCARCHDHKIDPIPMSDYYQMLAFFRNVRRYGVRGHNTVIDASSRQLVMEEDPDPEVVADYDRRLQEKEDYLKEIEAIVVEDFEPVEHEDFQYEQNRIRLVEARVAKEIITQEQFNRYRDTFHQRNRMLEEPPHKFRVLCVKENNHEPPQTHILIRGNPHVEGDPVDPGYVSVLAPPSAEIEKPEHIESSGRRLALARWIASPDNPLTARVMANRIWQHHFGRGIVRSANDFGFQGEAPTHPELLDWLAAEFVEQDWSLKQMHRIILRSSAYRMSGAFDSTAYEKDPLNNLFWRFDMRRLTAEEVRDSILAVSGRLNRDKMFGPSIFPQLSREVLEGQSMPGNGWGNSVPEDRTRRSIYIHVKRSLSVPLLANFDQADTDFNCPVRFNTTQPTQALGLLNSEFTNSEAALFAETISERTNTAGEFVTEILSRVMQRAPSDEEVARGLILIEELQNEDGMPEQQARACFCLYAINLNEFIFLD